MTLNLNSLSQTGGVIINNPFTTRNSLLKTEIDDNNLSYTPIDSGSNTFKLDELKSIKVFINFILPYISFNGKKLGLDAIKNIETLYGGSFGMTIVYDNIVIKISPSKLSMTNDQSHVKEVRGLETLFKKDDDPPVRDTLSKYYGFMCNKSTNDLNVYNTYTGQMNINSNLFENPKNPIFTIDEKELFENATKLGGDKFLQTNFLDKIVIIFLERDDMNLSKFNQTIMNSLSQVQKIEMVKVFLLDMLDALQYLHRTKFLIHCDIKPDNIVVSKMSDGKYKFKLIDFGSLSSIDKKTGIIIRGQRSPATTKFFYMNTKHSDFSKVSFAYDEYCVLLSSLMMLGIGNRYEEQDTINIDNIATKVYDMYKRKTKPPQIMKEVIDDMNKLYPDAKLLPLDKLISESVLNCYKLLFALLKTAPCKGGLQNFIEEPAKVGGALIFNEYSDEPNKVLLKTKIEGDKLSFTIPRGQSNSFTKEQKKSLEIMTNFILPHISFKGKKLGYKFIKEVETFGAGTFGVALAYDNLIIKVMIVQSRSSTPAAIKETLLLENLFNTPDKIPPDTLSKYYGFIAGKKNTDLQKFDTYANAKLNIISNLFTKPDFKIDNSNDIISNIYSTITSKDIEADITLPGNYLKNEFFSDMIVAFFDKEDGDMDKFINEICPKLSIHQKVLLTKDFFEDISWGLNFIHRVKNKFHSDIKPANIVYKIQDNGSVKFKLIDFGTLGNIDKVSGKALDFFGGTPYYYNDTRYKKGSSFSYMYDYFCTLCIVMEIWGVTFYDNTIADIAEMMDNLYKKYSETGDINITITELIKIVQNSFGTNLPDTSLNPVIKETYELLIPYFIQGNMTGGKPPPL